MNEIKFRLEEILNDLFDGNKSEMARAIEASQPSIKKWIEGISFPGYEALYNLCTEVNINPMWLILGIGNRQMIDKENNSNNNVAYQIGSKNSTITQIMHSNDILEHENKALKREITLLQEIVEMYRAKKD